jgi:hypothetical protein
VEVIRALGSEAAFIARFRAALRDGVAADNRATVYSALYIPLIVIVVERDCPGGWRRPHMVR